MEEWRDIAEYKGIYQISSFGRVRSLDRQTAHRSYTAYKKGTLLKPCKDADGYRILRLCKKTAKMYKVHRLVAFAFVLNPDPALYKYINHKDNCPSNNRMENLEWCTLKQNAKHRDDQGRQGKHPSQRKILQCRLDGSAIRIWDGVRIAERALGIYNISATANGIQNSSGGYRWKYLPMK